MIRETVLIRTKPGSDADFAAAVEKAVPIFQGATGCLGMRLEKVIEEADTYRLLVLWNTLEDHTVTFRGSDAFQDWRALAGPFFADPPAVDHMEVVVPGFGPV